MLPTDETAHAPCAIREIFDRVGDKWSVVALARLHDGPRTFGGLRRSMDGVSRRMLARTLRALERIGLISRTIRGTVPPSVEYELTALGHGLVEPLTAVARAGRTGTVMTSPAPALGSISCELADCARARQKDPMIERATERDLHAILALQRLAFVTEAELYGDYSIPPLTQTEASLREEFDRVIILKAMNGEELVGSVRGWQVGDTCHVARLAVHPDHRRQGIGEGLMNALESVFDRARRFELFTGERSEGNLRLYRRLGYGEYKRERLSDSVTLVFMQKLMR